MSVAKRQDIEWHEATEYSRCREFAHCLPVEDNCLKKWIFPLFAIISTSKMA